MNKKIVEKSITIPAESLELEGILALPKETEKLVIFAHGSGSSRFSPRNNFVAKILQEKGIATLLFDLLTPEEDTAYENRFNIDLLANRLILVTKWISSQTETKKLSIGFFGASTGTAAAIKAAAQLNGQIKALVSRGGRPDLAEDKLQKIYIPILLIVGGNDEIVITLNQLAFKKIPSEKKELAIIPGATHLFEEPGTLEEVSRLALEWFEENL